MAVPLAVLLVSGQGWAGLMFAITALFIVGVLVVVVLGLAILVIDIWRRIFR
jgi:hypothetical protein